MTIGPEALRRLSTLLDRAFELADPQREAWLAALHGEDAALVPTLRELLARQASKETIDLLDRLPAFTGPVMTPDATQSRIGDTVGAYRLQRLLGRGGMGEVWLAERTDGQLKRKVALKLPHVLWVPGLAERFAREREILANLEHPNIARLYDAGIDQHSRPFMAIEYIEGQPLDEFCKARGLAIDARLELLLQVADAVAFAHSRLVVHRDLKPGNMLVTPDGQVRLLDFGIAKLMEGNRTRETALTQAAGRALTLDYASPEQIRGEPIGTPSDVYSLGVVAFELLAGARPYRLKRQSAAQLEEAITTVDAPLASEIAGSPAVKKRLKGDLDAILNKALKKDVTLRYSTVDALAQDWRRHLEGKRVLARPDTFVYRLMRLVRRHRTPLAAVAFMVSVFVLALGVGATAVVILALLIGIGIALWQARAAHAEAARAAEIKNFALSLFQAADGNEGASVRTTAVDLLVNAGRRIDAELKGRPDIAVELMTSIGNSLLSQSKADIAAAMMKRATELSEVNFGQDDRRTVAAAAVYGQALSDMTRDDEAISVLRGVAERASRLRMAHEHSLALAYLASALIAKGDFDAGVASAKGAIDALDPASSASTDDLVGAWLTYAYALSATGRAGIADAARHALEISKRAFGDRVTNNTLTARQFMADGLADEGRLSEALPELERVLEDAKGFYGPLHKNVATYASNVGRHRQSAGDLDGASEALHLAIDIAGQPEGEGPYTVAVLTYRLGQIAAIGARWKEALEHYEQARSILVTVPGGSTKTRWSVEVARAVALTQLGRLAEAESMFASLQLASDDDTVGPQIRLGLSGLRMREGRHADAVELAHRAVAEVATNRVVRVRAEANRQWGEALLAAGRSGEALAPLREAVKLHRQCELVATAQQVAAEESLAIAQRTAAMNFSSGGS